MNRQTAFQLLPIVALAATLRFWGLTFGLPNTDARPGEGRIVILWIPGMLSSCVSGKAKSELIEPR